MRVPKRSDSAPQNKAASPMQRKSSVAAAETPPRDQPIASEIGCRNTASDSIAPIPTQVISAPAPTTIQQYSKPEGLFMRFLARLGSLVGEAAMVIYPPPRIKMGESSHSGARAA